MIITLMTPTSTAAPARDGTQPLNHWGLIRARGPDSLTFLQSQLTNDVAALGPQEVRLAGFCSAKGRLQASFIVWKLADDDVLLACAASVLAPTLKRLSMFVLRAKCKLSDAGTELPLHGVAGATAQALLGDLPTWTHRAVDGGSLLRLPDVDGVARAMLASTQPSAPGAAALDEHAWRALEVRSGIPIIEAATVDQFVPQMLNYEIVGGVDFRKGCYPGQEVVARSQYRGTIKRRMFLFEAASPSATLAAGQEVFHDADAAQPAGMVVNAAGGLALIEVKLATLERGSLHAGGIDGPLLMRRELPYSVPSDAALPA